MRIARERRDRVLGRQQLRRAEHPPAGRFAAVAAGFGHTCAIRAKSGAIECWGQNEVYQWNDETQTPDLVYVGLIDPPAP